MDEEILTDSSNILLLKVTSPQTLPPAWELALTSLAGDRDQSGWIRLKDDELWEAVLRIACGTRLPPEATVTVYCEIPPESGATGYRRLWDRTEELAGALAEWGAGKADWPRLRPGELVRLAPGCFRE